MKFALKFTICSYLLNMETTRGSYYICQYDTQEVSHFTFKKRPPPKERRSFLVGLYERFYKNVIFILLLFRVACCIINTVDI